MANLSRFEFTEVLAALLAGCSSALPRQPALSTSANTQLRSNACKGSMQVLTGGTKIDFYSCTGTLVGYVEIEENHVGDLVFIAWKQGVGTAELMEVSGSNRTTIQFWDLTLVPIYHGVIVKKNGTDLYTIHWRSDGSVSVVDDQTGESAATAPLAFPNISDQCIEDTMDLVVGFTGVIVGAYTSPLLLGLALAVAGTATMVKATVAMKTSCNR